MKPKLSLIVAKTSNDVIAEKGNIPWKLYGEQAYFKKVTMGHPMIMGRKTYDSIGKALPGRTSIIITRQTDFKASDCVVANSKDQALEAAKKAPGGNQEIFVIGGQEIFDMFTADADKLYLTEVHASVPGDKFFHFNASDWRLISSQKPDPDPRNKYDFVFKVLERKAG